MTDAASRLTLDKVVEVGTTDGRVLIRGFDPSGAHVEIELTLIATNTLIPNLVASEAELMGESEGKDLGPVFFYGGADLKNDADAGHRILVMKCLPANQGQPSRKMGFRLSTQDLAALGRFCSKNGENNSIKSGGRPN